MTKCVQNRVEKSGLLLYNEYVILISVEGGCSMDLLKKRILKDGKVYAGNILKVDSFLNHQIDVSLLREIGKEFYEKFQDCNVTKVLTIEASGIGIACVTAQFFDCSLVFAKKTKTKNIAGGVYTAKVESFTHGCVYDIIVSKEFLNPDDRVLIVDDFLAKGNALVGLIDLVNQAGAELVGCGIVIEKGFQGGGDALREGGVRVESLAIVDAMDDAAGTVQFRE